jgi:hypothetical protein
VHPQGRDWLDNREKGISEKAKFQFLTTPLKVNGEAWLEKSDGFAVRAIISFGYKSSKFEARRGQKKMEKRRE